MNDKYILDDDGNPIPCDDLYKWGEWMQDADRRIDLDHVSGVEVSTVFLGLDHRWGDGPPLIYETMIFGGPHDQYQERYSTREEALAGHRHAVWLASNPGGATDN